MTIAAEWAFLIGTTLILSFYVLLHISYLGTLALSIIGIWQQPRHARTVIPELILEAPTTPPVTLLVPAYNELATIVESLNALLALRYPGLEIIVINDGSTDETLRELIQSFSLRPADLVYREILPTARVRGIYLSNQHRNLTVVDKANGGKSDSLNVGINLCRTPWMCSVDADSILEEDALMRVMRPAIEDNAVVACSGIVRIANGCRISGGRVVKVGMPGGRLAGFQTVEYLHGFLQGRLGWSWLNALLIISGAFGVFRTDVLRTIGGYSRRTVAEDMDVVVRIHAFFRKQKKPYRVVFVPDPVCWTEVPEQIGTLRRQRRRWQRGLAQVLATHSGIFFGRGTGAVGFAALPLFALEVLTPAVELAGFVFMGLAWFGGWLRGDVLLLYLTLAFLLATVYASWAVLLEEYTYRRYPSYKDLLRLFVLGLTAHFGYHQMVSWWRLEGLYEYFRGIEHWGEQKRVGFRRGPS